MRRKKEIIGASSGAIAGAIAGGIAGAKIGIASGGWAIPATVPLGIIGGFVLGAAGKKVGSIFNKK